MSTYYVDASGESPGGYTNFTSLFGAITQSNGDIIEVVDNGEIDESASSGLITESGSGIGITADITIRSWPSNTNKPTIKINNLYPSFSANYVNVTIQDLKMYKTGPEAANSCISLVSILSTQITGCEFWVVDPTYTPTPPYDPTFSAVFCYGSQSTLFLFNNNKVHNMVYAIVVAGYGDLYNVQFKNNVIYDVNFVFAHSGGYGATCDTYSIINNSIYNVSTFVFDFPDTIITNWHVLNNTIKTANQGFVCTSAGAGVVCDYNDINDCATPYIGFSSGAHDILTDPLYTDPDNGDLTLQSGSPAIDTGIGFDTYSDVPLVDYDGNVRPSDIVDMGAYEFILGSISSVSSLSSESSEFLSICSELDIGNIIDISGGDAPFVSTLNIDKLELLFSIITDANFSNSSKWDKVIVIYKHDSGQSKKLVHKLRSGSWTARGIFSNFSNSGTFRKENIVLIDYEGDMLVIERNEIGTDEDLTITN